MLQPPRSESVPAQQRMHLSNAEQCYIQTLRKRERNNLMRRIESAIKRPCVETPLRIQVLQSSLPNETRHAVFEALRHGASDKYLQWVRRALRLPLDRVCTTSAGDSVQHALDEAKRAMDGAVVGFDAAKTEVLRLLCQSYTGGRGVPAYSIGLQGAPGTGKTHFVRHAMTAALHRPMVSIQLGGASDVSYLLGQVYAYEGSREGRLAAGLIEAGCCDPIIYFDEVDKVSETERGRELIAVLIHLIDPTANDSIRDRYFHDIDIDFSRCIFVFSYNDDRAVNPVLMDRIKRVVVPPPTREERLSIVREHIVPRVCRRLGTKLSIDDAALRALVLRRIDDAAGMRNVERDVDQVMGCVHLERALEGKDSEYAIGVDDVTRHLVVESSTETCVTTATMMYA